jgi:surface antigen
MRQTISIGDKVTWRIGNGLAEGEVIDAYQYKNESIDTRYITRRVDEGSRALLIQLNDGRKVLKLEAEVQRRG